MVNTRKAIMVAWGLTGVASLLAALTVIAVCWMLNPWFIFWEDAFSDFGGSRACCPWLYNWGLIFSALLLLAFSLYVYRVARHKVEAFASALLLVSAIFLALIGVFPSGTRPHTFVSTWFFVQVYMAFAAIGAGMYVQGARLGGAFVAGLASSAPFIGLLVEALHGWPSAAVAEAVGIAVIGALLAASTPFYVKRSLS